MYSAIIVHANKMGNLHVQMRADTFILKNRTTALDKPQPNMFLAKGMSNVIKLLMTLTVM